MTALLLLKRETKPKTHDGMNFKKRMKTAQLQSATHYTNVYGLAISKRYIIVRLANAIHGYRRRFLCTWHLLSTELHRRKLLIIGRSLGLVFRKDRERQGSKEGGEGGRYII
jgi:hypothetical protein